MKKILGYFLLFSAFFALMLELTNGGDWSWRSYINFVVANIEPFPQADLSFEIPTDGFTLRTIGEFFTWLGDLLLYPLECLFVLVKNALVIVDGFLPFDFNFSHAGVGESGGGSNFGSFGGGGFGGGGGGAR